MHKVTDVGLDDSEVRSNQLGRDIREWRNKWELTQSDVANLLGVHRTTIAGWEEGKIEHPQIVHLAIEAVDERVHAEQLERWEHSHWTPFSRRLQPAPEPEIHAPLQPRLHQAGDSLE